MNDSYKTVDKCASAELIEKKSRFIAHVKPILNEEEAVDFIKSVKSKYFDATHNVYAYSAGHDGFEAQRYSDDGEPQGTAGIPVLEVIKKNNLKDVCIVVTRYFGGTLLGASGLIRAYGRSASLGVSSANIIEMILSELIAIYIEYSLFGLVQSALLQRNYTIESVKYGQDVELSVYIRSGEYDSFVKLITELTNDSFLAERKAVKYIKNKENSYA